MLALAKEDYSNAKEFEAHNVNAHIALIVSTLQADYRLLDIRRALIVSGHLNSFVRPDD